MIQQLSMRRLFRVLRWLYAYEARKLSNLFLSAVVVSTSSQTYGMYYNLLLSHSITGTLNKLASVGLFFCSLLMFLGATFAFTTLYRRHAGHQLLLLPASNREKFLALWVLYVPVLFVLLLAAFVVGDCLRALILPFIIENGNQPSVIPYFFRKIGEWMLGPVVVGNRAFYVQIWSVFFVIHAFSLFSSIIAGYLGWLLTGVTLYGCAYFTIGAYGRVGWHVPFLLALTLLFFVMAYRLFCRYPLFKLFTNFHYHGI